MSKAFIKEDTDLADDDDDRQASANLLQGKNYITPAGLKRLQDEHKRLKMRERPEVCRTVQWAAENGDRSENADYTYGKKRLREIDRRLRFLNKRIQAAEVIDQLRTSAGTSFGGAWLVNGNLHVAVTDGALTSEVSAAGATPMLVSTPLSKLVHSMHGSS